MRLFLIVIYLTLAFLQISIAQTKLLTMEDAIISQKIQLSPAKLKQLMWIKGTNNYTYVETIDSIEVLILGEADNQKKLLKTLISITELNEAIAKYRLKALKSFPQIKWKNASNFTFETEKKLFVYDLKSKLLSIESIRDFGEDAENMDVAANTNYVAFTIKNNLFIFDGKENLIVTNDANENIVNGKSVHREEFGIVKGTFWSPTGNLLAYYRMDQTMVADYPIIDWTARPAKNNAIKYPMAGDPSHEVTIPIYNVSNGKTTFLKTGEPKEQYLTNITWSPDEQSIYIAVLNRDQNILKLNSYSVITGLFERTLFEEKDEKYVEPKQAIVFLPKTPNQFIWQSARDGYNHLYLYDTSGKLIKQLTKGNWVVTNFAGFDEKGITAFYTSTSEGPCTRNFYSLDIKKEKIIKITSGDGTHTSLLNSNGKYIIDNFQSTQVPREIAIYHIREQRKEIIKISENPLKEYKLGQLKLLKLKSENGDDLYCRIIKPMDFDSTKKYPVIVYLYGGPGVQLINETWNGGGDLWLQYMAERGYIVFSLDNRGSANRGKAFEQATFQHLGNVEMKDQLVGINYLKNLKYVDQSRMGVFGWSFGGFMTTTLMTQQPNLFKVAVAGGPVIDWSYYEIMYTERYMDTPQANPTGYNETKLLNYVDNLKGKLMLIHGTDDNVVVLQHSLLFLKAAVEKGKQVDFFVYPGHEHNVLGKDRVHLFNKITDYFTQNL